MSIYHDVHRAMLMYGIITMFTDMMYGIITMFTDIDVWDYYYVTDMMYGIIMIFHRY